MKGLPHAVVCIVAIAGVVVIECMAVKNGINGRILGGSLLIIGALGGVNFDRLRKAFKGMIE